VRFGTVLAGPDALGEVLGPSYEQFEGLLDELDGQVEVNLKVHYDEDTVLREIVEGDESVRRARSRARRSVQDSIDLGERVAQALEAWRERDADAILASLAPLATETVLGDLIVDQMVLNAAFLVPADSLDAFDEAVDEVGRRHGGRLRFRYFGPLPPYSFSAVELGTG
jgi:vacuolar-type H+-ATPase subunit I/STV1